MGRLPPMLTPTKEPVELRHKRWKHRERGYEVKVESIRHFHGKHGYFSTVTVIEKKSKVQAKWPVQKFIRAFEPLGRSSRPKTAWQRL
jgi:hypothetical protein